MYEGGALCYKMLSKRRKLTLFRFCLNLGTRLPPLLQFILKCSPFEFVEYKHIFFVRVDPCAVCEDKPTTPLEIAEKEESGELLKLLGKFTKIPDDMKLRKLSQLMYKEEEEAKEQFRDLLRTLPKDSVRGNNNCVKFKLYPGEHDGCAWGRNYSSGSGRP